MKTEMRASQVATHTFGEVYGARALESPRRRSGAAPESSGIAPGALPIDPLDASVFGKLVALEADAPGFLAELVVEFESGVTRRLAALQDAARTGDADAIVFAAHSIRGSCGTVGAMRMAALANHLEYGRPSRPQIGALVRQLTLEWDAVRRSLDSVRP
jgi:HPt (histidine-containing phosphotransfer) domain-containing protein